jgi:hypothetical protein
MNKIKITGIDDATQFTWECPTKAHRVAPEILAGALLLREIERARAFNDDKSIEDVATSFNVEGFVIENDLVAYFIVWASDLAGAHIAGRIEVEIVA